MAIEYNFFNTTGRTTGFINESQPSKAVIIGGSNSYISQNLYNKFSYSGYSTILNGTGCSISYSSYSPKGNFNNSSILNGSDFSISGSTINSNTQNNMSESLNSWKADMTNLNSLSELRKNIIKQWDESGLLEGLDHAKKSNIAVMLDSRASRTIKAEDGGLQSIKLRFNHKFTSKRDLWKLIIDGKMNLVSNVTFLCSTETTMDFDKETNDYKSHISCDANSVHFEYIPNVELGGDIINVTVKNITNG